MTTLLEITAQTASRALGVEVPEICVVIAKHSVMGMDSEGIIDILGCTMDELQELESDATYKMTRQHIAAHYVVMQADQSAGWDAIEGIAIRRLAERLPFEKDSDFLLKAAAVANRAVRRHNKPGGVLDPMSRQGRTTITLTSRLTKHLSGNHTAEVTEERQLSISDGSMQNPKFEEVDSFLSVSAKPTYKVRSGTPEITDSELEYWMQDLKGAR